MKQTLTSIVICALTLVVTAGANAHPRVEVPACEVLLGLGHRDTALGDHGLLGTIPGASDDIIARLLERDILPWTQDIMVVPNLDEAHRRNYITTHAGSLQPKRGHQPTTDREFFVAAARRRVRYNPLRKSLFVLDRTKLDHLGPAALDGFLASIPRRPIYELDSEGRVTRLDPELVSERLDPSAMTLVKDSGQEATHIEHAGFFYPRHRAVISLSGLPHPSSIAPARLKKRGFGFEIGHYGSTVVLQAYGPAADGERVLLAEIEGQRHEQTLYLNAVHSAPGHSGYAKLLLMMEGKALLEEGVSYVDATKVWEFHQGLKVRMIPRR